MARSIAYDRRGRKFPRLMRLPLVVPATLALASGCATDRPPRAFDFTYPQTQAAGPVAPAASGPASAPTPGGPPIVGQSGKALESISPLPSNGRPASPASTPVGDVTDPEVKPMAGKVANPPPSPSALVIPPPEATYRIDLATALRLADVSNPTIGAAPR